MIPDMILRPKAQNEEGRRVFLITMIAALLSFVASLFLSKYQGLVQLGSVVALCVSLYFYTRYVASVYSYEVTADNDGTPIFVIRQTAGSRVSTHCRMPIGSLVCAELLNREQLATYRQNKRAKAQPNDGCDAPYLFPASDIPLFDYSVTFRPTAVTLLCFRSRDERCDMLVELSEEFASLLLDIAAQVKSESVEEEGE